MSRSSFSIRWILLTLLVIAAVGVMVRLGFWQLDRLAERREANSRILAQVNAENLDLNKDLPLDEELNSMEYRPVIVTGIYDSAQEVLLRNQVHGNQLGYAVITPLQLDGKKESVMVQRGWIPPEQSSPELRTKFTEPGPVTVRGIIRLPSTQPNYAGPGDPTLAPGQVRLDAWSAVNLDRIQQQVSLDLLPIYIQQAPDPSWKGPPYRSNLSQPDLTDGPHLLYAIQWFLFSAALAIGYPILLRRRFKR
jgi:surfeit locus 1 family protein